MGATTLGPNVARIGVLLKLSAIHAGTCETCRGRGRCRRRGALPRSGARGSAARALAGRSLGGIVHTHSTHAVAWAQAGRDIPYLGTTHADHFRGPVPVSRLLSDAEIGGAYEAETSDVIVETIRERLSDALRMPAVLVRSHGPFTWGRSATEAAVNAVALEAVAAMALHTLMLEPEALPTSEALLRRHFDRKHGPDAYYGQPDEAQ